MKSKPSPEQFSLQTPVLVGGGGATPAGWHSIGVMHRCPKAFQLEHVRGIRVPQSRMPAPFAIGILFAAARRTWFGERFDSSEATWKLIRRAMKREAEEQRLPIEKKDSVFTEVLMSKYIEHWLKFPRPRPLAAEYLLGPAPLVKDDPFNLFRTARLDDLSYYPEAGGALCIGEAKTTSGDVGAVVREYELHGQPLLYSALYKTCPNGEAKFGAVNGVVLDVTTKPYEGKKPAFSRVFVEIRPSAIEWFVANLRGYLRAANKIDWDAEVPRNVQGCTYMAGRARVDCTYKELCRFGVAAAGRYVLRDGSGLKKYKPQPGAERLPWE